MSQNVDANALFLAQISTVASQAEAAFMLGLVSVANYSTCLQDLTISDHGGLFHSFHSILCLTQCLLNYRIANRTYIFLVVAGNGITVVLNQIALVFFSLFIRFSDENMKLYSQ